MFHCLMLTRIKGHLQIQRAKGKGKALMANSNSSKEWIFDSGASYHMGSSKEGFSSLK